MSNRRITPLSSLILIFVSVPILAGGLWMWWHTEGWAIRESFSLRQDRRQAGEFTMYITGFLVLCGGTGVFMGIKDLLFPPSDKR
jgi:hypothetical protein